MKSCQRLCLLLFVFALLGSSNLQSQQVLDQVEDSMPTIGQKVPAEVRDMYRKGLKYLSEKQKEDGSWPTSSGFGSETAGVSAICTLAFLSAGEDPNFGRYASQIRRGVRHIILAQNPKSGLFKGNTYDYGFALLLLAEAYGAIDDKLLWAGYEGSSKKRTIAEALELAVRAAIVPEKTERLIHKTWYSTGSSPAQGVPDTSVAGSILVGLLAARNAGIEVPDDTVDKAIAYFEFMTNEDGTVGYMTNPASAYGNSVARSAITTLVLAIGKRRDSDAYTACRDFIIDNIENDYDTHVYYGRYYMAQALFQSDYESWQKWNRMIISKTLADQNDDGSLGKCQYGSNYSTGISLLSLALNFRILPVYER